MATAQPRRLIVTGGTGYIGRAVVAAALAAGWRVSLMGRGGTAPGADAVKWALGEPMPAGAIDPELPSSAQVLVHLAHDWDARSEDANANLAAAEILRDSARALGVGRVVFISSLSAREAALNVYGRTKWRIERLFDANNEVSLRVGLVYGGPRTAMYGLLCRLVGLSPVLPMIEPRQPVQPIHRSEVARGVLRAAEGALCGPVGLAGAEPIAFGQFLDTLALRTRARRLGVVPLPLQPVLLLADIANALPFLPSVDRERILGLAGTRYVDTQADLARLGLSVQPFATGMLSESVARRVLVAEARALLRYVLRAEPGGALVRRYARAVLTQGEGALALPSVARRWPGLLQFLEPLGQKTPLGRRLALATALAEASPEGERALTLRGRPMRLIGLAVDGAVEALALPMRLALSLAAR